MRIAPATYLVASGAQGCSLTHDLDCNCWLFDSGEGLVLFDTGAGLDTDGIFSVMTENGLTPDDLQFVFLTHAHGDHSAGARELQRRTGCKVLCSRLTSSLLDEGEPAFSLDVARAAGVYPDDFVYTRPSVDALIADGETLAIGDLSIEAIATPGHSLDHHSYLVRRNDTAALVTGDAIFHSGRIIYQGTYDFDIRVSAESIRRLGNCDFEILLPGHGFFVRHGGRRHVDAAILHLEKLMTPRPIEFIAI
ncbi:glyoxylase-like metal-dependent hydrolase (beta-lactamase superfamily II) [Rhizobium azooxidifex]|uniref:Glyoxylase-like metal-dependent hydrolase (Beta-lactamase superfamily II) n=1 Tax=Mycoplana azooxidifex TaxID=1636188 RepID=A0A7W6DFV3_9HYPH|nr:MBL fold metallo-hydrolase [Mycoplana azooxidifex]MBB3979887.1 glyoxylase-like metal-dependent hydrolase (beta-lactamase superfamily II) [Mycoplana azooxidifex]